MSKISVELLCRKTGHWSDTPLLDKLCNGAMSKRLTTYQDFNKQNQESLVLDYIYIFYSILSPININWVEFPDLDFVDTK